MSFLKGLAAAAAMAVIVIAFRDARSGGWLAPVLPGGGADLDELDELDEEPVLGYDGMDVETLRDWLADAGLDRATLLRMQGYEEAHLGRESVLAAIDDQLG